MVTKEMETSMHSMAKPQRRLGLFISNLTVRLLIAFVLSWLIILVFFISGAISH